MLAAKDTLSFLLKIPSLFKLLSSPHTSPIVALTLTLNPCHCPARSAASSWYFLRFYISFSASSGSQVQATSYTSGSQAQATSYTSGSQAQATSYTIGSQAQATSYTVIFPFMSISHDGVLLPTTASRTCRSLQTVLWWGEHWIPWWEMLGPLYRLYSSLRLASSLSAGQFGPSGGSCSSLGHNVAFAGLVPL